MSVQVITNAAKLAILAALAAEDGPLDVAMLRLFQNDVTPSANTVVGDLTAATYTGYAAEAITWLAPSISTVDGEPEMIGTAGEFRPTGTTVTNEIWGYYITTAALTLFSAGKLDSPPEPFDSVTNALLLTVRVRLNPLGVPTVEVS